jgi:hypothetical protein
MATDTLTRDDRIELRTTKEEKRLLSSAAAYERLDLRASSCARSYRSSRPDRGAARTRRA